MFVEKRTMTFKEIVRLHCASFLNRIVKRRIINSSAIITSVILQNILN